MDLSSEEEEEEEEDMAEEDDDDLSDLSDDGDLRHARSSRPTTPSGRTRPRRSLSEQFSTGGGNPSTSACLLLSANRYKQAACITFWEGKEILVSYHVCLTSHSFTPSHEAQLRMLRRTTEAEVEAMRQTERRNARLAYPGTCIAGEKNAASRHLLNPTRPVQLN